MDPRVQTIFKVLSDHSVWAEGTFNPVELLNLAENIVKALDEKEERDKAT